MRNPRNGDEVLFHVKGRLANGYIFEASPKERPRRIILGLGQVVRGLEVGLSRMRSGDKRTVEVSPHQGYGDRDESLVHRLRRAVIPNGQGLSMGDSIEANAGSGTKLKFMITHLDQTIVVLDANHPLAGRKLFFDIEVIKIGRVVNDRQGPCSTSDPIANEPSGTSVHTFGVETPTAR